MGKSSVGQSVFWGATIPPDKEYLEIDGFTLVRDFPQMHSVSNIYVEVEAGGREEAEVIGLEQIKTFLDKWNFLDDSGPQIPGETSVRDMETGVATHSYTIGASAVIVKEISDELIAEFASTFPCGKVIDKEPLRFCRQGRIKEDLFERYRDLYKVLEFYEPESSKLYAWIEQVRPNVRMVPVRRRNKIVPLNIFSSIRHRLSHATNPKLQTCLMPDNPQDVQLVRDHLPELQKLAKEMIRAHI